MMATDSWRKSFRIKESGVIVTLSQTQNICKIMELCVTSNSSKEVYELKHDGVSSTVRLVTSKFLRSLTFTPKGGSGTDWIGYWNG